MSPRSWAFDIGVAAVVGVLGQLEAWWGIGSTHRQGPLWAQALLYAVTAALLAGRRLRPLGVQVAIVVVSTAEFAAFGAPEGYGVALPGLVAAYSVGRYVEPRRAWWGLVVSVAFWLSWSTLDPLSGASPAEQVGTAVWILPAVVAWLSGALVRMSRLHADQRLLNEEQRAQQAVAEERNRIARELHDVLGHSVSVMTVQASAVRRRLAPDQTVERQALVSVEAVGREALAEMRRMVGVLRQPGDPHALEPPPGLDQLDRLAEQFRSAGLPVTLSVTGDRRQLAPGLDATAYRLVQEGLTNTLRHAEGATGAAVTVDFGADRIELAVRDDGTATGTTPPPGAGHGLVGMRERVAVYGGSLVAAGRPEGGFELVATLPLEPA